MGWQSDDNEGLINKRWGSRECIYGIKIKGLHKNIMKHIAYRKDDLEGVANRFPSRVNAGK